MHFDIPEREVTSGREKRRAGTDTERGCRVSSDGK